MNALPLPEGPGDLRPMGIETEYGMICLNFSGEVDFAFLASQLVRANPLEPVHRGWDYSDEDGRLDFSGRRHRLARDARDITGSQRRSAKLSREQLLADTILPNGARYYNDHNHPEYCTDVTGSIAQLARQDAAGEVLLLECQQARNRADPDGEVLIVKNNTDHHGRSYGTHENYLCQRRFPLPELIAQLVPFLVARIAITGAGKAGVEGPRPSPEARFQISQRADFFEQISGIDTTARRPIFNTRDEPHSDRRDWRRLHVICGDANRSQRQTALKCGATAMVLDLIEAGVNFGVELKDPVAAATRFSRDLTLTETVPTSRGNLSLLDVLEIYLAAVEDAGPYEGQRAWVAREWRELVDLLRRDPLTAADRLDWCAKLSLITALEAAGGPLPMADLRRLDTAYSYLDPRYSLHRQLLEQGQMLTVASLAEARSALTDPPTDTRARLRGTLVLRFSDSIESMDWDSVVLKNQGRRLKLNLGQVRSQEITVLADLTLAASSVGELFDAFDRAKTGFGGPIIATLA